MSAVDPPDVAWLTCADYPLPPNEEKTEILRVVVRESLSIDMIDRLITDICSITENLMQSDQFDVAAWQPASQSVEVRSPQAHPLLTFANTFAEGTCVARLAGQTQA